MPFKMPGSPLSLKLALYIWDGPPPWTPYFTLTALLSLSFTGHPVFFSWLLSAWPLTFSRWPSQLLVPNWNHLSRCSPALTNPSQSTPYPASVRPRPCPVLPSHFILFPGPKHSQSNSLALLCLNWFVPMLEWTLPISAPGRKLV